VWHVVKVTGRALLTESGFSLVKIGASDLFKCISQHLIFISASVRCKREPGASVVADRPGSLFVLGVSRVREPWSHRLTAWSSAAADGALASHTGLTSASVYGSARCASRGMTEGPAPVGQFASRAYRKAAALTPVRSP
jgi:hypothetical protein